jgi:hypothetical protein
VLWWHANQIAVDSGLSFDPITHILSISGGVRTGIVPFELDVHQGSCPATAAASYDFAVCMESGTLIKVDAAGVKTQVASGAGAAALAPVNLAPPAVATFGAGWINQGGATATAMNASLAVVADATASDSIRALLNPATTPYTVTAAFATTQRYTATNVLLTGLVLRESGTGRLIVFSVSSAGKIAGFEYANPTTYTADLFTPELYRGIGPLIWLRAANTGTTRTLSLSMDGVLFTTIYSGAGTVFLTEDQVGIAVDSGANLPVSMTVYHYAQQ